LSWKEESLRNGEKDRKMREGRERRERNSLFQTLEREREEKVKIFWLKPI
jgi:hypothetical protein